MKLSSIVLVPIVIQNLHIFLKLNVILINIVLMLFVICSSLVFAYDVELTGFCLMIIEITSVALISLLM